MLTEREKNGEKNFWYSHKIYDHYTKKNAQYDHKRIWTNTANRKKIKLLIKY